MIIHCGKNEIIHFITLKHPAIWLSIEEWENQEDYFGEGCIKYVGFDMEGNQYNMYIDPKILENAGCN